MRVTRLPAGALTSYVKQSPDTCGKRPSTPGIREIPFSRNAFTSAPVTVNVTDTFPNGSTPRTDPRVTGNGGGEIPVGQNPPVPAPGQVRSARRPPEFVIAKSVPYAARNASVVTSPTFD